MSYILDFEQPLNISKSIMNRKLALNKKTRPKPIHPTV